MAKQRITAYDVLNEANRQSTARDTVDSRSIFVRASSQAGEPVRDYRAERERERRKQELLAKLAKMEAEREEKNAKWKARQQTQAYIAQAKENGTYEAPFQRKDVTAASGMNAMLERDRKKAAFSQMPQSAAAMVKPEVVDPTALQTGRQPRQANAAKQDRNTGWRSIGDRLAFVTPDSPLPAKSAASPEAYLEGMRAVDRYREWKPQSNTVGSLDEPSGAFLHKWMGKTYADEMPSHDDVLAKYSELAANPAMQEMFWNEWNSNGALSQSLPQSAGETERRNESERQERAAAYGAAVRQLGPEMAGMAGGYDADYYRFLSKAADGRADGPNTRFDGVSEALRNGQYGLAGVRLMQEGDPVDSYMTDEQRKTYDALYKVYGKEMADEYRESLRSELNRKRAGAVEAQAAAFAKENPVGATAWSMLSSMVYTPLAGANTLVAGMTGGEADPYDPMHLPSRAGDAARATVAQGLGGAGGFLYNTGLSTLESIAGNKAFGFLNLARMGLSSMESTYNDAIDRDATNEEAMGASVLAGLAEVVFEKVSLENFIKLSGGKGAGKFVMNVVKQGGIEASEETCTELANALTDYLTMGGRSNYSRDIEAYMSRGMSEDEARRNALLNVCKNVGLAGAGGFLSGGVSGTFAQGTAAYNRRAAEKAKQAAKAKADSAQGAAGQTAEEAAQAPTGVNEVKGAALRSLEAHDPQGGGQPTITIRNRQGEVEEAATAAAREANRGGSATAASDAATSTAEEAPAEQGGLAQTETQLERATREYYRLEELYEQEPAPETKALMDEAERRIAEEIEVAEQLEQAAQTHARGEAAQQETKPAPVMHRQAETEAGEAVTVTGVESAEDGVVYYRVEHQDGTTGVLDARDVEIADADVPELLASERARRLGTTGMAEYLDNYNPELARPEQYAHAYVDVYARARVGMSYEQAVNGDMELSAYLDATAAGAAYEAGVADSRRNAQSGARMAANVAVQRNANEGRGMERTALNEENGSNNGDARFSIREENGKRYVEIDADQDIFEGLSGNETLKKAKEYITGHFKGKFIGEGEAHAYVSGRTAKEYSRPKNRRISEQIKQAKGRASTELDKLLSVSTFIRHEDDNGSHPEACNGWDYYETTFRIDGKAFTGTVNILNGEEYRTLHDITNIKQNDIRLTKTSSTAATSGTNVEPIAVRFTSAIADGTSARRSDSGFPVGVQDAESTGGKTSIPKTAEKSKATSGVARRYTQAAWEGLAEGKSAEERRRIHAQARAQLTALDRLARNLGVKITVVDAIQGQANGMYNPKTGEITIALDAMNGAYLYTAMHELTHKLKNEHGAEWAAFENLVRSALETNGVNINEEIAHQLAVAKRNGLTLSREAALEEVICNAASGVLTDEAVIKRMVTENRTLAQRIADFLKGFLEALDKAIAEAGERLGRYRSWGDSFKALQRDRQSAKRIYDALMEGLGSGTETQGREGARGAREGLTESGSAGREKMKYSTPPGGRLASNGIERDMNDAKRAEVLRSTAMEAVPTAALSPEGQALVERLGRGGIGRTEIEKAIIALPEYKAIQGVDLHSDSITVPFRFSNRSLHETLTKMMAGGKFDFLKAQRFVRLLGNFSEQLKKATAVEVHTDRYLGRVKEFSSIENYGVLLGVSRTDDAEIPVLYEMKNLAGGAKDQLYLVATFGEIKKGTTPGLQHSDKLNADPSDVATYSIADYVKKIHTRDEKLLKYFPDELLSPEQAGSAKAGRLEEEKYILKKIGVGNIDLKTGRAVTQEQLDELDARIENARNGDEPMTRGYDAPTEGLGSEGTPGTEAAVNIKYSKKEFANGNQYVEADRQVIVGNDPGKWGSQVRRYINEKIREGKNVTVYAADGDALTISRDTAGKAAFRNKVVDPSTGKSRLMTDKEYAIKLRAESHIDELAEVSLRGKHDVQDTKKHSFAKDGFNYRTAYFKDTAGYYKITISVGKNGQINTIYNVGKIVKAAFPQSHPAQAGAARGSKANGKAASTPSILPNTDEVNTKYSLRDKEPAAEPEPPLADSDGRKLSAKQSAYFKHSKARDENGNLLTLYHGTMNAGFTRFENQLTDGRGAAFFFTDSRDTAVVYAGQEREAFAPSRAETSLFEKVSMIAYREGFAEKYNMEWKGVYEAYLDLRDPLELDAKGAYWDKLRGKMKGKPGTVHTTDDWAEYAREKGYDGLLVRNVRDGSEEVATVCVAFEPRQVKSVNNADPTGDPDIRYSLRDTDEHVQEGLTTLESALAQTRAHRITAMEADELAGRIIKAANSTYDRQRLAGEISRIYDYAERGGADIMQLDDEQTALMARVMEKSRVLDLEHEERMKPVRDYLRTTKISLTDTMLREAENQFGSVQAYRRAVFGRVRLNQTSGTPLDSVWGELSTLAPELFDEDASEGDMARLLLAAVDAARPQYTDGRGMSAEESAQYFAGELNRAYLSLPGVKASAKNKAKLNVSAQTYANAMKRFADASWTEYQNALRGLEEGRREQKRTERQKHAAAMRRKYAQWRERDAAMRREREMQNRWRPKIEQTTAALLRWYENPTDAKHIPEDLRETVLGVVASLDFTGGNTRKAGALSRQIAALADALDKASAEPDVASDGFTIERDQMWIDHLNMLARMIPQHKAVYELNGAELRELSKWMDSVRHVLTEVNRMHGTNLGSVAETAEASIAEMKGKKPYYLKSGALKAWSDTFGIEMQDSFTFFKRLGPTAYRVFENVRKGFDKSVENLREAKEYMEALLKGINVKGMSGKAAPKTKYALQSGDVVKLTRAQVMELYCLNRREQARRHLYGGGIRIDGDANVRAHALTRQDVAAITGTMTAAEIRIADGIQRFLSVNCARWGNEASMLFFGYRKFTEHSYYPIRTDSNTNKTTMLDDASEMARISAIRNAGMTKATTQGASNAIVLGSIFDTYTRHVSQMNAYNAYAIPLYDMQRWMNTRGVKTEIEQLYGKAGTKYVMNFFKAINGTAERSESPMTKPVRWLTRNAKTAAVGANIQVAIQQPTSYVRAISMISGKYLAQGVKMKKQPHLVDKYCAIAQWKKWGFYETDVGPNLKSMLLNDQTPVEKAKDASLWLAGKGDEWTLNHLWNACELETQDLYPELKQGTEEYYRQVGARMSEIVDRTQVVDSVFHRSQAMRRKDSYTQLLTSFMAEPIKSYNMVMESVAEYAESRGTKNVAMARRKLARALTAYALSGALAAAAKSLTEALRDDDEDKAYWEKYIDRLGANLLNAINPLSNIPIISDTIETVTNGGQSANRLDSQSIERIGWLVEEVRKLNEGKSTLNWYGMTYKTMQTVSSVTGVPISNLMRDANAIVQTATGRTPTLSETGSRSIAKDNLYKAMIGGDKEAQKRLRQKMKNELGMGEKEIDAAMGERLARDERIAAGWEAKTEKRVGDVNRLKNALAKEGFTGEMVDKAIKTYGNSVTVDEDTGEDKDEPLRVSLYTQDEAAEAVRGVAKGTVNAEDVKLMLSEMAADSTVKGTEGERQQSVIGSVQSRLKPEYLKMERAGDEKGMKALERAMNDALGTREETFAAWRTDDHSARLREAVDARDSKAAKEAVARCRKDGRDDSSIKSSLSAYKAAYIEAYRAGDRTTANEIRRMLKGLGLKSRKGDALYADETFAEWLEGKK